MPRTRTAAAIAFTSLAVADTILAGSTPRTQHLRRFTKPLLMPSLAAAFADATPGRGDLLHHGTLAAQAFSWAGDVALLGKGRRSFLTGVGSFAAAHGCYVAALGSARRRPVELDAAALKATAVVWMLAAPAMAVAAGRKDRALAIPVAAYVSILSLMFATSTTLDPSVPTEARRRITAGAVLFLISDTVLGIEKFVVASRPWLQRAVMATYTAGQALLAAGVASAGTASAGTASAGKRQGRGSQ